MVIASSYRLAEKVKARCSANISRSSMKPMMPMVSTATMILASDCDEPFWNSSQTNFPRPGFLRQHFSRDQHHPAHTQRQPEAGEDQRQRGWQHHAGDGPQCRQLQNPADIHQVLVDRGHAERRVDQRRPHRAQRHGHRRDQQRFRHPVIGRRVSRRNDHGDDRQPGQGRHRLENLDQRIDGAVEGAGQTRAYSQRNGDQRGDAEAEADSEQRRHDLVDIGRLAGIGAEFRLLAVRHQLCVAFVLAVIEGRCLLALADMVLPQIARLFPDFDRPGNRAERGLNLRRQRAPGEQEYEYPDQRNEQHALELTKLGARAVSGQHAQDRHKPGEAQRIEPAAGPGDGGKGLFATGQIDVCGVGGVGHRFGSF